MTIKGFAAGLGIVASKISSSLSEKKLPDTYVDWFYP